MVLQLPTKLKDDEQLTPHDLPAVEQFTDTDVAHEAAAPLIERGTFMPLNSKQLPQTIVNNLSAFLAPEHLAGPLKFLYRPIFLSAIGLHALLLFAGPGGKHEEKKEVKDQEKPVTITQIATGKAAPKKLNKVPTVKLPSAKPTLPKLSTSTNQTPSIAPSKSAPETASKPDAQTPDASKPLPKVDAGAPTPDITPPPPGGGAKQDDPFKDFNLIYPGAVQSGIFYRASGTDSAAIEGFFKGQSSQGFAVKAGSSSPTRQVIEVSKAGTTRYIGLFPDGADLVYMIAGSEAEIPANIDELKKVKALPTDYAAMFEAVGGVAVGAPVPEDFSDYTPYFASADPDASYVNGVVSAYIYDGVDAGTGGAELVAQLGGLFKTIAPVSGGYGGGQLYKMTGDTGEFFLNVLPSKDGGMMAVTFESNPR